MLGMKVGGHLINEFAKITHDAVLIAKDEKDFDT